ncbi:helix-turn-helix domain-containing protein [Streptomyces sp. MN03-5084-2B]|nr:helix-turn-helix domain-containing protein [Streptomyces sp. MN03-5084-2B]
MGAILVARRKLVGWSQEQLAERSNVSVRTIRNLETGAIRNPRRSSVDLLVDALRAAAPSQNSSLFSEELADPAGSLCMDTDPRPDVSVVPKGVKWVGLRPKQDVTVGRRADLMHVVSTIRCGKTLVLTGSVGVGKTRLALAAAAQLADKFPDGVAVVELGAAGLATMDERDAVAEICRALDSLLPADSGVDRPGRDDLRMLLVIDDAERVLDAIMPVIRQLLDQYPGLRVLITSLQATVSLPVDVWEVAPLPVDQPEDGAAYPAAAELFRLRVASALPTLDLGDSIPSVVQLCRRLGGLPLAIEIAAFRMRSVPLGVMLAEGPILPILEQKGLGGLSHQRSLRQGMAWAFGLLDNRQRGMLARLSQFTETFSIDDALDLISDNGKPDVNGIGALAGLVDVSAVRVRRDRQYVYEVPELMREYVNAVSA